MTATDARQQLQRLQAERLDAVDAGLAGNELYMADLETDIAASRAAYVALAVTEIATLRGQLSGAARLAWLPWPARCATPSRRDEARGPRGATVTARPSAPSARAAARSAGDLVGHRARLLAAAARGRQTRAET